LDWATVSQYRTGENPARWRGHLEQLLPAPSKVQKIENHRALPWAELPAFMLRLKQSEGIAARALELLILTAARSGEIRGMRWDEVDLQAKVWTLPAHRMKAGRVHRVPLSNAAMRLLQAMPRIDDSPLVFPSPRGGALSDMSLTAVTRRMAVDCVPHGFRSSFRDWAGKMRFDPQITELCLSHKVKSETVGAYWREDALEWRTDIMQQWADYLDRPAKGGEVIAFKQARA
jgi:integrase